MPSLPDIQSIFTYTALFMATYFEVFLMITLFETKAKLKSEDACMDDEPSFYPTVTIIIPCFNEEKTVEGTINSILSLDYPQDKLTVTVIDDGSSDNTWNYIQKFKDHPRINIYHKENGGKHTALNWALERTSTDLVGCLDADSFVDVTALKRIVRYFENPAVMAVTPACRIHQPKTIIQAIQYVEYHIGIMVKKLYSFMNAIYVTPGPFTIFRKRVFDELGPYKKAHNTEDMEIALRMHKHHYQIVNCHKAFVYTVGPRTLKTLYKQRVRWTHGFLENALDYRSMFFNKNYGNISWFTLPFSFIAIATVLLITALTLWEITTRIFALISRFHTVGFHFYWKFDPSWIYLNTHMTILLSACLLSMTFILLMMGRKIAEGRYKISHEMFYFVALYPFIAPLWVIKSVYNTAFGRKSSWR